MIKIIRVPEINIGTFGHVDHGKTTLVEAITGKRTDTHSEEQKRGITIRLGYADATFYKCQKCGYFSSPDLLSRCPKCDGECVPLRTVSFVDAPGHETLTATVLAATAIVDGALLVIDAKDGIREQTREHLMALNIARINKVVIIQNKIDLVSEDDARKNFKEIKDLVKGTVAEHSPIIPVSAQRKINIDFVIQAIEEHIPTPKREQGDPKFLIGRSFDINRPGTNPKDLKGGVLGGSLVRGMIRVGDELEIRPGIFLDNWRTIRTKIFGIKQGGVDVQECRPGGLIGLLTGLDPSLTKSDSLAGNIIGLNLPPVLEEIVLKFTMIRGVNLERDDTLMLTHGVTRTVGIIQNLKKGNYCSIKLKIPICSEKGERVVISKQIEGSWRLIGYGELM